MSVKNDCSTSSPRAYDDVRGTAALSRSLRQNHVAQRGEALVEVFDTMHPDYEDVADVQDFVNSRRSCED